jgi:hypothetical protein
VGGVVKAFHGPIEGYTSPLWLLEPTESRVFIEATRRCKEFAASGKRPALAVRMAFWEIVDTEVRS